MSEESFTVRFADVPHYVPYKIDLKISEIRQHIADQWKLPYPLPTGKFWLCRGSQYVVTPEQINSNITDTDIRPGMTLELDFLGPSLSSGLKNLRTQRYRNKSSSKQKNMLSSLAALLDGASTSAGTSSSLRASDHEDDFGVLSLPILNVRPREQNPISIQLWAAELFNAMENAELRARISGTHPQLVESYLTHKNFDHFRAVCTNLANHVFEQKKKMNDPKSAEGQRHVLRMIKAKRIQEALMRTHEFHPELLVPTTMLYINMTINDVPMPIMIDSGAQCSIMSERCARESNLIDDIDDSFKSTARGVGGANQILGRVHLCDVRINGQLYPFSFDVIKSENYLMLFGLNMMKTLGCHIDLKRMKFVVGDGNETPFLSDAELKAHRAKHENEDKDIKIDEKLVARLTSMGFNENKVKSALESTGNQFDLALRYLTSEHAENEKMDVDESKPAAK